MSPSLAVSCPQKGDEADPRPGTLESPLIKKEIKKNSLKKGQKEVKNRQLSTDLKGGKRMFEKKSEESININPDLLMWIHQRVAETSERGSIYMTIEKGRITWINYEKNNRFNPPAESSSPGPHSSGFSVN